MSKLSIQTGDENIVLRKVSEPVKAGEIRAHKKLIEDMLKYIKNPRNGWVGLAAPQVGVNKRIIVVSLMKDYDDESYRTIAMINPKITEHASDVCLGEEWCLSLPGESGEVSRWKWVQIEFLNPDGMKQVLRLDNLAARIVQHEIDHLDGILFTDRVTQEAPLPEVMSV